MNYILNLIKKWGFSDKHSVNKPKINKSQEPIEKWWSRNRPEHSTEFETNPQTSPTTNVWCDGIWNDGESTPNNGDICVNGVRKSSSTKSYISNPNYSNYISENINRCISYAEYVAENIDRGVSYYEYISKNIDINQFTQYIDDPKNYISHNPYTTHAPCISGRLTGPFPSTSGVSGSSGVSGTSGSSGINGPSGSSGMANPIRTPKTNNLQGTSGDRRIFTIPVGELNEEEANNYLRELFTPYSFKINEKSEDGRIYSDIDPYGEENWTT